MSEEDEEIENEESPDDEPYLGEFLGIFNDDGTKVDIESIPKPSLCVTCRKDGLPGEQEIFCLLQRNAERDEPEFTCGAYEAIERPF